MGKVEDVDGLKLQEVMKRLITQLGTAGVLATELLIDDTQLSRIMSGDRGMTLECVDAVVKRSDMVIVPRATISLLEQEIKELEDAFSVVSTRWNRERARNGK